MRSFGVLCLVPLLLANTILAQVAPAVTDSHRVMPFQEYLNQEGVESPIEAFTRALSSSNPKVRTAAAFTLAQEEGKASIPSIENALRVESVPLIAVQLSEALSGLNDPLGKARLNQFCSDAQEPAEISALAMRYLVNRDAGEGCVDAAIVRLHSPSDGQRSSEYLLLLSSTYPSASEAQKNAIIFAAESQLNDTDPYKDHRESSSRKRLSRESVKRPQEIYCI